MATETMSISDKLRKAYILSNMIVDHKPRIKMGTDMSNKVYAYADGLIHEYFRKHIEGRCSIQAMIDFDMDKEEQKLDKDITDFQEVIDNAIN